MSSFRISDLSRARLELTADRIESNQTFVLEQAIREYAERHGIEITRETLEAKNREDE